MTVKQGKCKNGIEDDGHTLNSCILNQKFIMLRHNHPVGNVAVEPKNIHNTANIWIEGHGKSNLQLMKPDITMMRDGYCFIIKVMHPSKTSTEYLEQRACDKTIKPLLNELSQINCHSGEICKLSVWLIRNHNK